MKKIAMAMLLALPLAAFGAGWEYYVMNESGEWESVSPRNVDLSMPSESGGMLADGRRIMIVHIRSGEEPRRREPRNWLRQVSSELVEQVE